jgi:hypothetical protein
VTRKGGTFSVEAAENQLNILIERRAKEADDANHYVRAWAESVRRYDLRAAAERRRQWIQFHNDMERLHSNLAGEHREKAAALASEDEVEAAG